jgi:Uma2 family endonuclease
MSVTELVPVEEYLATDHSPDWDFVDGVLEFYLHTKDLGIRGFPEQRIRVSASRYRVPDICVTVGLPDEQVFTTAPFLCIEILSPEDQMPRVLVKIAG